MPERLALMLSDVVDSTRLAQALGEATMAGLWAGHDRAARNAIRRHGGREIGRSDGLLAAFPTASAAVAFAADYHRHLAPLHPEFRARVGLHWGEVTLRPNSADDVAAGATPFEVDGVALPLAARVMSVARGGQTLASAALVEQARREGRDEAHARSHGHWRMKGIAEPVLLLELPAPDLAPTLPPEDGAKGYRVVRDAEGGWRPAREIPHNLHHLRDRLFGRRDALQALARSFDEEARLITLMGIGGIGKTRCALAFARQALGDFPGGVWFCDLSAATSLDGVAYAVASALEVPLGKGDALKKLGTAIAGRGACLIVLDNFEQVARLAEASLGAWLGAAPEAKFLVTSREMLGIAGERVQVLEPLGGDEAVRLFRDRALAAGASLDAVPEDLLVQLVQTLDRLPLAIELAAARAPLLAPQQMLERMRERFRLLAAPGARHDRQATLRATLDWSWELLDEAERQALAQVSVFEGGFTLEAAEAVLVLDEPGTGGERWAIDTALQGLLRKSLLRTDAHHRFELLRSVQDYAAERLDTLGSRGAAESRHAACFASFSEAQATTRRGIELDNLVLACGRAAQREPGTAARCLHAAWSALRLCGPFAVALRLAEPLAQRAELGERERALVDRVIGGACLLLGDPQRARRHLSACMEASQRLGDPGVAAAVLAQLAALDLSLGAVDIADSQIAAALGLADESGDPEVCMRVRSQLGTQRLAQGRFDEAASAYADVLALATQCGLPRWIGGAHGNLGVLAMTQGDRTAARTHFEQALALAHEVGDRQWEGNARCNFGLLLHELGEQDRARRELEASLETARAIGHTRLEAMSACNLGLVEEAAGDLVAAERWYRRALVGAQGLSDENLAHRFTGYLALCLARRGAAAEAAEHVVAAAETFAALVGDPLCAGILAAQLSITAALIGDAAQAALWLREAERRTEDLDIGDSAEAALLLGEARARASVAEGQLS